jgi:recombination protein RecT
MSNLTLFNKQIANPRTQEYLAQVLGEKRQSFVNNLTALVANNAKLQECEPIGLMYAGIKATALDLPLDPNLGFAYVIPYKNNRENKTEAQFQIGYKGFIQLAIRSGQFRSINVTEIKEGELLHEDMLTGDLTFKRAAANVREGLKTVGYAAFFRLNNGFEKTLYFTVEAVEAHAKKYSQTYGSKYESTRNSSKWATDFDAMAKKTVLKMLLSKYAPLSVEMQQAVVADQAVFGKDGKERYIDNEAEVQQVADVPQLDKATLNDEDSIRKAYVRGQISVEEMNQALDKLPKAEPATADAEEVTELDKKIAATGFFNN